MINLYYDKIIDGVPAPNGTKDIALTKDARQIPYVKDYTIFHPISVMNTFYFIVKANKVVVNLYTEKQKAKNLFYPIELADQIFNWDRDWGNLISKRAKRMIQKNHMKLLILAPKLKENHYTMIRLNARINELIATGISPESVVLVIGEIKGVYKNVFSIENVYGIDYQQIYTQMLYKTRWGMSKLDWIFGHDTRAKTLSSKDIEKEYFDIDNWNPTKTFNFLSSSKDHDIALILEILYKNISSFGNINFKLEDYNIKELNNNYIDPRKSSIEKNSKIDLLKNLKSFNNTDELTTSLINVVCDDYFLNVDTAYKPELNGLAPGFNVWSQIATGQPFMVIGCLDTMKYLNNEKYFSYNEILEQTYDSITVPTKRVELIVKNLERLGYMEKDKINKLIQEAKPFMKANRQRFFEKKMAIKLMNLFVDMKYE